MLNSIPYESKDIKHSILDIYLFTMWTYTDAYATVLFLQALRQYVRNKKNTDLNPLPWKYHIADHFMTQLANHGDYGCFPTQL